MRRSRYTVCAACKAPSPSVAAANVHGPVCADDRRACDDAAQRRVPEDRAVGAAQGEEAMVDVAEVHRVVGRDDWLMGKGKRDR